MAARVFTIAVVNLICAHTPGSTPSIRICGNGPESLQVEEGCLETSITWYEVRSSLEV